MQGGFFLNQKFGIPFCIGLAVLIWLFTTTMTYCWINDFAVGYSGPAGGCETDSLITKTLKIEKWPLQYFPFTAYWDAYDDKFLWLTSEPYNRLLLIGILAYGLWFGMSTGIKRFHRADSKATKKIE